MPYVREVIVVLAAVSLITTLLQTRAAWIKDSESEREYGWGALGTGVPAAILSATLGEHVHITIIGSLLFALCYAWSLYKKNSLPLKIGNIAIVAMSLLNIA